MRVLGVIESLTRDWNTTEEKEILDVSTSVRVGVFLLDTPSIIYNYRIK